MLVFALHVCILHTYRTFCGLISPLFLSLSLSLCVCVCVCVCSVHELFHYDLVHICDSLR